MRLNNYLLLSEIRVDTIRVNMVFSRMTLLQNTEGGEGYRKRACRLSGAGCFSWFVSRLGLVVPRPWQWRNEVAVANMAPLGGKRAPLNGALSTRAICENMAEKSK